MTEALTYCHTPDMGEISGFGGGYELACQRMLDAGVKHIQEKKLSGGDVQIHGYSGVYGLCFADNEPTKELEAAAVGAVEDCTGAMHQAIMSRLAYIAREGWEAYCTACRAGEAEAQAAKKP